MFAVLLISILFVIVNAENQYIAAEVPHNHAEHREHAPKQQQESLQYEPLIQKYNQKHGIKPIKLQWHYIPSQHGEEEKKPVNIELFVPNLKARWHYVLDNKKNLHHDKPDEEHVPLSNLKHNEKGGNEKIIEDYKRVLDTPKHNQHKKVEHQPHVLIRPHSLPHHQIKHKDGHPLDHNNKKEAEPKIHHNIPLPPHNYNKEAEKEILVNEQHHKNLQPIILFAPQEPHQHHIQEVVDKKLIEEYGRLLDSSQHIYYHKDSHQPNIQHEGYGNLADEYKALLNPPEHNQHHTHHTSVHQQHIHEVNERVSNEYGHVFNAPEHSQNHNNGQQQILIKPYHEQHRIPDGMIDDHGRLLIHSDHTQHHNAGQHRVSNKPHRPLHHGLHDKHGRLLINSEHKEHHNTGQGQAVIKSHVPQHHGEHEVSNKLIEKHGRLLYNPEHSQPHNGGQHQVSIKNNEPPHHGEHGVPNKLINDHKQHIFEKQHLPQHHPEEEMVHERLMDEYGCFYDNLHQDHQIISSNKDTLIELNRLKELSKEGDHYIRPHFDQNKIRHHELVDYLEQLLKKSIAYFNHAEQKKHNNHHNKVHEHETDGTNHEEIRHNHKIEHY